ncbi:hypothetical protein V3H18_04405 [Methylocystis sp. 9N]|uniref:Uncharacterized protein n=1 Tax=Methylocystis borbori TaxID=3118750 RepID=A0ABU7XH15_9HYPH
MATSEPTEDKSASNLDNEMVRWTRAVAIFTGCLVIASVISDWFIYQQWSVANQTQADNREQLRALVSQIPGNEIIIKEKDGTPTSYVFVNKFQNHGGTRTSRFIAWASIRFFQGGIPNSNDFSKPYNKVPLQNSVISPNSSSELAGIAVKQEDVIRALNKEGEIIMWGHAEYADIFHPEITHHINFCTLLNPTNATTDNTIVLQPSPYSSECNNSD